MRSLFFSMLTLITAIHGETIGGWNWYKAQPVPAKNPKSSQKPSAASPAPSLKEVFESTLQKAVEAPTPENVTAAYRAHARMLDRASTFSKMWMQVSLSEGGQTLRASDNPHPFHRKVKEEEDEKALEQDLKNLAKTHGLFFLGKKGCPYCTEFVPIVAEFARTYGFEVLVVGDVDPNQYPFKVMADNGVIHALNTKNIYPALFVVNTQDHHVYPLSWGLSAPSDLKRNARIVLDHIARETEGAS